MAIVKLSDERLRVLYEPMQAYNIKAAELFGKFANLNIINE